MEFLHKNIPSPEIGKTTKTVMEKLTDLVSGFLGSWWAVIFHFAWFTIWLILNFDLNLLTFSVSLEAIFIGIFLLMSANKAEKERDEKEAEQRAKDRERIEADIKLDQKADRQLIEIKNLQKEFGQDVEEIKKQLGKLLEQKK